MNPMKILNSKPSISLCMIVKNDLAKNEDLDLLGNVYIKLNQYDKALDIYLALYQLYPNQENISRRIAGIYAKLGHTDQAMKYLDL
jgi:tetratricopeptide (TPR) repeat protein